MTTTTKTTYTPSDYLKTKTSGMIDSHRNENASEIISKIVAKETGVAFDFHEIKDELKKYLRNQDKFYDYDFEASGLSYILDVLAYNSQMNAMTAHLALNELYLETAQARPNVVVLAKQLGYLPTSVSSATAVIDVELFTTTTTTDADVVILPEGSVFKSNGGYLWTTSNKNYIAEKDPALENRYIIRNVEVKEGTRKIFNYFVDTSIKYKKYEIPDFDVDLTTLRVSVKPNRESEQVEVYEKFETFNQIQKGSKYFFLNEAPNGRYELYFSEDDELGGAPENGNLISISYVYSNGPASNGANSFSFQSFGDEERTSAHSCRVLGCTVSAFGGAVKENIESIRYNAPNFFKAQNRCVTVSDYVALIRSNHSSVESVSCWGGETNNPPEYGKVFLSLKPYKDLYLSTGEKKRIKEETLKKKGIVTVHPVIVDPDYTFIQLGIQCQFDPFSSDKKLTVLKDQILNVIDYYNRMFLNSFDRVFRYSQLLSMIDRSDIAIINSAMSVSLYKELDFSLALLRNNFQMDSVKFPILPYRFYEQNTRFLSTSPIYLNNTRHYLKDYSPPIGSDNALKNRRQLKLVHYVNAGKTEVVTVKDAGYLDLENSIVSIKGFRPDATSTNVRVYIKPSKFDVASGKNQLLQINEESVNIDLVKDSIKEYGALGVESYNSKEYRYL